MATQLLWMAGLGAVAFLAGVVNSVAGGGSLLSFPALIAFGQPPIIANATNTTAVMPGTLASAWAYRRAFPTEKKLVVSMIATSFLGGLTGAAILVGTPPALFVKLTPYLVLFATLLFAFRKFFSDLTKRQEKNTRYGWLLGLFYQFLVATYGGYFGAGAGLLMLASFALMEIGNINTMNALKTTLASCLNGIAIAYFAWSGLIVWHIAFIMAVGAILGGYFGARVAQKLNQAILHRVVVGLGLTASAWLFMKS